MIVRSIKKVGGSLALLIPRDLAEAIGVSENTSVRVSTVGRQLVMDPDDNYVTENQFHRAFAAVLRREGRSFQALADFDSGRSKHR